MTKITFFLRIYPDRKNLPINGSCVTTGATSHCPSGSYARSSNNKDYERCYIAKFLAGHNIKCFDVNGKVNVKNKSGNLELKSIPDLFPRASKKEIMDLGRYTYYLAVTYNNLTSEIIKKELNDVLATTYEGDNGVTIFQQALFGSSSPNQNLYPGTPDGFCDIPDNIETKVYKNYTCATISPSDLVPIDINTTQQQKDYCLGAGSSSLKCACYNVSRPDAIEHCTNNPELPGCKELMANKKPLDEAGLSGTWQGSTSGCLAPNACTSSGIYKPYPAPITNCELTVQYCKQTTDIKSLENSSATVYETCKQSLASDTGGDGSGDGSGDGPGDGLFSFLYELPIWLWVIIGVAVLLMLLV